MGLKKKNHFLELILVFMVLGFMNNKIKVSLSLLPDSFSFLFLRGIIYAFWDIGAYEDWEFLKTFLIILLDFNEVKGLALLLSERVF